MVIVIVVIARVAVITWVTQLIRLSELSAPLFCDSNQCPPGGPDLGLQLQTSRERLTNQWKRLRLKLSPHSDNSPEPFFQQTKQTKINRDGVSFWAVLGAMASHSGQSWARWMASHSRQSWERRRLILGSLGRDRVSFWAVEGAMASYSEQSWA